MSGKPNTLDGLKNSISNILQLVPEKTQRVVGMLINLKIIKRYDEQIRFRKKVLKQWLALNLNEQDPISQPQSMQQALQQLQKDSVVDKLEPTVDMQSAQQELFKTLHRLTLYSLRLHENCAS